MTAGAETTYREALGKAIADAMAEDESVLVLGEEVGRYGGAYGVTRGLLERFGPARIVDTPISEPAIVGSAVGMALQGLRPIAELMYVDFLAMSMDQLANQAAKIRYMFGGETGVPLVLRTQGGTGRSAAAQHSQSLEGWGAHVPGLRVAMPATINDAYHLLRESIKQPDPVLFIEHKRLYVDKGVLSDQADAPWGKAHVCRAGKDATLVTYSRMLHFALEASEQLAGQGIDCEVINLRTLNPLDEKTVADSVRKTNRAAVITEATTSFGPSAEISARIQESCFDYLEEPVIRIAGEDVPISVSPELERSSVPDVSLIAETIAHLVDRKRPAWG